MSKKSNLKILDDAVARIIRVIENDDGENPIFSEVMAEYEKKWLKEFYNEARKNPTSGRKTIAKSGASDKKDMPVRQN
jgi:hypothetical protein